MKTTFITPNGITVEGTIIYSSNSTNNKLTNSK